MRVTSHARRREAKNLLPNTATMTKDSFMPFHHHMRSILLVGSASYRYSSRFSWKLCYCCYCCWIPWINLTAAFCNSRLVTGFQQPPLSRPLKGSSSIITNMAPPRQARAKSSEVEGTKRKSTKKSSSSSSSSDEESSPQKKKAAKKKAPAHQVLTERDEIPRLWDNSQATKNGSYSK